ELIKAFKGARIRKDVLANIVAQRPYQDIEELALKISFTPLMRAKIQDKLSEGIIYFS
ncbi:MAG: hypothetical protein F6K65_40875, partial [Moorea sp. SIO3C2]|nr:hypothetical protein [Moorena sp. SIO3C2]